MPINKNVHWYLAIICYPYLMEPVFDETIADDTRKEAESKSNRTSISNLEDFSPSPASSKSKNDADSNSQEDSADEADPEDSNDNLSSFKDDGRACLKM